MHHAPNTHRGVSFLLLTRGLAVLVFLIGIACKNSEQNQAEIKKTDRQVVLPRSSIPASLDPAAAGDITVRQITAGVFDNLLDWDPKAKDPTTLVPEIAVELPTLSEDGKTLRFRLRAGDEALTFAADPCLSNPKGRPIQPSDVRVSLLRQAEAGHGFSLLANRIEGFDDWKKDPSGTQPAIIANDSENTLVIQLTRPQPEFLQILANPQLAVVPPECVEYYNGKNGRPLFAHHPVGSGPFIIDHSKSDFSQELWLRRNEARPKHMQSKLPNVVLRKFGSMDSALALFKEGKLALFAPHQAQIPVVFTKEGELIEGSLPSGVKVKRWQYPSVTLLLFSMRDPIVGSGKTEAAVEKNRALRRAVSLAFDAKRYHQLVRIGQMATPQAKRLLPPGIEGSQNEALNSYASSLPDLERAGDELSKAGFENLSENPLVLRYHTDVSTYNRHEADLFRESLRPLGIKLDVRFDSHYQFRALDPKSRDEMQLFSVLFTADYLSAESFFQAFTCNGDIQLFTGFCDPDFDLEFKKLQQMRIPADRSSQIQKLEAHLAHALPARPIDFPLFLELAQPWLEGVIRHPISGLRLETLQIKD